MALGILLCPLPDKLRLVRVKWFILDPKWPQQQDGVSGGLSMTYLVNFSILPCLRLCVGGWIEVCPAQAFYLDLETPCFCLGFMFALHVKGLSMLMLNI